MNKDGGWRVYRYGLDIDLIEFLCRFNKGIGAGPVTR